MQNDDLHIDDLQGAAKIQDERLRSQWVDGMLHPTWETAYPMPRYDGLRRLNYLSEGITAETRPKFTKIEEKYTLEPIDKLRSDELGQIVSRIHAEIAAAANEIDPLWFLTHEIATRFEENVFTGRSTTMVWYLKPRPEPIELTVHMIDGMAKALADSFLRHFDRIISDAFIHSSSEASNE